MGREPEEQVEHDHVVALLRREYYNYPNQAHPHLLTLVNHPSKSRGVLDDRGEELFPDIVVLQPSVNRLVMVAEVETASTINAAEAEEWSRFSRLGCRFYLYFPLLMGKTVASLCRDFMVTEFVQYWKEGTRYVLERYVPEAK